MNGAGIVITGGTRGLGRCLASEFLGRGADVFIIGTTAEGVGAALAALGQKKGGPRLGGGVGDIRQAADLERLAAEAQAFLGRIDHWINNAGVNQAPGRILDLSVDEYNRVLSVDLLGPLQAARAARPYLESTGGFLWFMEGHGSDGRIIDGLSLYGTSKRALAYLWRALAVECAGQALKIGALSPGIMITDFILAGKDRVSPEAWAKTAKAYNVLADRPETVAAFLAPRILEARKNGTRIAWLTGGKVLGRFLAAPFSRRHLVD